MEMTALSVNTGLNSSLATSRVRNYLTVFGLALVVGSVQPALTLASENSTVEQVEGEVTVIHIDEMNPQQSRTAYFLQQRGSTDFIEMRFDGQPPKHIRKYLRTGKKIRIKGRRAERQARRQARQAEGQQKQEILVSEVAALDGESSSSTANRSTASATAVGDRKTITFLVNMDGVDYSAESASPFTATHAETAGRYMYDSTQFSVNSAYKEASFGQVTFSGSASTDVFVVSVPYDPAESCAYRTIANNADAVSPVNVNGYRHKLYVVPPKAISGCSWLAIGEIGSYDSTSTRKSWSTRIDPIAFAHELGHNIGWHHAATDPDNDGTRNVEYGDTSDLMGYCCAKRTVNSVHMDQAGWFDRADLRDKVLDVTEAGQFTLAPLGTDPAISTDPQILRITPANGWPYYLSYRQRTGKDSAMSSAYTTGVNIHRGLKSGNWSHFIKVLKSDFSDPNLYQFQDANNDITVSQVENNANYVKIDVSFASCVVQTPQVSVSPNSQLVGVNNQIQPYTVTVTNKDSAGCDNASFSVMGIFPSGAEGTFQDSVLDLAPSESGTTTMNIQLTSTADTTYSMMVKVSDSDPKHQGQASVALTVDTTAPTAPTGLSLSSLD